MNFTCKENIERLAHECRYEDKMSTEKQTINTRQPSSPQAADALSVRRKGTSMEGSRAIGRG